jgi:hypothetical protein
VVVNRFWAQLFGVGLVKTVEDFGTQAEWPSHPEVLDTLARDFVDGGWDVKDFFLKVVTSSTYRQTSDASPELYARDPENRLLARGPRVRLTSEQIRDQALAVSGLLAEKLGGPSVRPYQPESLYKGIVVDAPYPSTTWDLGKGDELYRRSLYTFWKRTVPHPAMLTFDSPDREFCSARRSRTNTPLQALVLWNETGYLESSRKLGERMLKEGGADDASRAAFAFRLATGRAPLPAETEVLTRTYAQLRADFSARPDDAAKLIKVGVSVADPKLPAGELASAAGVANLILTLDETITKNGPPCPATNTRTCIRGANSWRRPDWASAPAPSPTCSAAALRPAPPAIRTSTACPASPTSRPRPSASSASSNPAALRTSTCWIRNPNSSASSTRTCPIPSAAASASPAWWPRRRGSPASRADSSSPVTASAAPKSANSFRTSAVSPMKSV